MKTKLNIKSFRVFDEYGVMFEINPITILTGSNSSGKSSVVKAIFLLNSFLSQIKKAVDNGDPIQLEKYKLDFTQYPNNLLGRFDKVINNHSRAKTITIEYSIHSLILSKEVNIQLVFSSDENDELNNAYLDNITISLDDKVFYCSSKESNSFCNLNTIKDEFATFLLAEYAIHSYIGLESNYEFEGDITKEEYESDVKKVKEYINNIDKKRKSDILRYVRLVKRQNALIKCKEELGAVGQVDSNDSFFAIPLLDELAEIKKEDFKDFVTSHFLNKENQKKASTGYGFASQKVINAFLNSEFDYFTDFFADFEIKYLEHVVCLRDVFRQPKTGVYILQANQLALRQNYICSNPNNRVALGMFDKNLGFVQEDDTTNQRKKQKEQKDIEMWENKPLTFDILYEVIMEWNRNFSLESDNSYFYEAPSKLDPFGSVYHLAYQLLTQFAEAIVLEAVSPDWCGNMSYVSSARANVSRLYTLDNNNDFSILLQNYFEKKRIFLDYQQNNNHIGMRDYTVDSFMNKWIEVFGIGKAISLHVDEEGLGVQIRLHKVNDSEGKILADEGYGITQLMSILLQIETAILSAQGEKVNRFWRLEELDHYDFDTFHYEINTIAIEEPEIHLHPKYQSLLADMFVEAYKSYNIHFVIETHSEYLIRKLQLLVSGHIKDLDIDISNVSLYYVNSIEDKSRQKVRRIGICRDGYLDDTFGEGFYDEATRLSRQLM